MKLILQKSNTSEVASVASAIRELNRTNTISEDAFFTHTYVKLEAKTKELIEKMNAGGNSVELHEKDELRDLDIRSIFYEVEAKCTRRPDIVQESALRIKAILGRYGLKITQDGYSKESTNIKAMVNDLKSQQLIEDRARIPDLDTLIVNLENSQKDFDQTAALQIQNKVERDKNKTASEIARELKNIINNEFCIYIRGMAQANPSKFNDYAELLAKIIEDSNSQVRKRLAALNRKKEEKATFEA